MNKKQQTTEHKDSHGHIISHHAPAALLRAEKNIIKLGDIQVHLNKLECREKVHFFL